MEDRLHTRASAADRSLWCTRGLGGVLNADRVASPEKCALTADEWEVAHLYAVFAFEKVSLHEHCASDGASNLTFRCRWESRWR